MTIKLNYFDYDLVETYYTKGLLDGDFWVFLSHGNELRKPETVNADKMAMTFLEKTVAAIRLYPQDYAFMVPTRFWQQNTVYTEYDNQTVLERAPFFVAVEPEIESGNYHVFKCISNNYGAPSLEKPTFNQNIVAGVYEGGDGYIWKYMTSVPYKEYRKFSARGFMPVFRNGLVENTANTGIFNIKVQNRDSNFRYELISGEVASVDSQTRTVVISTARRLSSSSGTLSPSQDLDFSIGDFYADRVLRVNSSMTNNILGSRSYKISNSGVTPESERFVVLAGSEPIEIAPGDSFEISPEIVIRGDGTGAKAIPIFSQDRIVSIRMLDYGTGYKNATAYITTPRLGFSADKGAVEALLRPIVSPIGGHGSNVIRELNSKVISVGSLVSSGENSEIPSTGTYSKIGLVKSPAFRESAVFTKRNRLIGDVSFNRIFLEDVNGITPGMTVSFGDAIPSKTVVTSIFQDSVFISANIEKEIPIFSPITFSSVIETFDNRIKIVASSIPGDLQVGETVTQGNVSAVIHEINYETNTIYLIEYAKDFSETIVVNQPILTRLGSIGINTIEYSPYEQKSGEVLYISDATPIIRDADRVEQLRVIIQF